MTIIFLIAFRIVIVTASKRYSGKYVFLKTKKDSWSIKLSTPFLVKIREIYP